MKVVRNLLEHEISRRNTAAMKELVSRRILEDLVFHDYMNWLIKCLMRGRIGQRSSGLL